MDHVAIMKKSWGMVPKILAGEKVIESRWYKNRTRPFGEIKPSDVVYFKNSCEPVSVRAKVSRVLEYERLDLEKIKGILKKYGPDLGIDSMENFFELVKHKNYCVLVHLEKPEKISPFEVNKEGFGAMAAWISVSNINLIKIPIL